MRFTIRQTGSLSHFNAAATSVGHWCGTTQSGFVGSALTGSWSLKIYKETEYPTLEFCEHDVAYSATVCPDIDCFFAYKKLRFSNSVVAKRFFAELVGDRHAWEGVFLVDIDLNGWDETATEPHERWITYARTHWDDRSPTLLETIAKLRLRSVSIDIDLLKFGSEGLLEFATSLPDTTEVFINPQFTGDAEQITEFISSLNDMLCILARGPKNRMLFPARMMKRSALLKHPCNAYVCKGLHCHSGKSGNPRHLFVRTDRKIVPESEMLTDNYIIYDLAQPAAPLSFDTEALERFAGDMKWLFKTFVVGTEYDVIPVAIILPLAPVLRGKMQ